MAKIVVQVTDRILRKCHAPRLDADRCEKFRAIPGKQVETAARGCTIRVGSLTCLRRDGAEGHLGKPPKCYNCNSKL